MPEAKIFLKDKKKKPLCDLEQFKVYQGSYFVAKSGNPVLARKTVLFY